MATFPTLKVYCLFDDTPWTYAGTYYDITSYVRVQDGVRIRRGGSSDPDAPDHTGILTLTLDNTTRLFDSSYTAGTYYGKLLPKKQIAVYALWSGVEYPIFWGWVREWPTRSRNVGQDFVVDIEAYDALGMLAGSKWNADPRHDYINSLTPANWLEIPTAASVTDIGTSPTTVKVYPPGSTGPPYALTVTDASIIPTCSTPSAHFDSSFWWAAINGGVAAVSFWIQTSTQPADEYLHDVAPITTYYNSIGYEYRRIGIETSGRLVVSWDNNGTASTTYTGYRKLNDGKPHHVVITYSSGAWVFYIDGVSESYSTATVGAGVSASTIAIDTVGASQWASAAPVATAGSATILKDTWIQDFAAWGSGLTAAQVLEIYNRSIGDLSETTAVRAQRILDNAGVAAGYINLTSGPHGTVKALNIANQSTLTALQQVERSEQGRLYATNASVITLRQRYYAFEDARSNTVQEIFSDDGADESYRAFGQRQAYEDVANDVTVTTPEFQASSSDSTSQTAYGQNAIEIDTILSTQAETTGMAAGVIVLRKDVHYRVDPIPIPKISDWVTALGLELADRIKVEATPMGVGSQLSSEVLIESIQWDINSQWILTLTGQPAPLPATEGFWTLGTSELDTGTILAY